MVQILWHGRGGQGAFTSAKLLGAAYSLKNDDSYALAFPSFGPERRGAPIRAFTKLDKKPIQDRSETILADYIIFLDDTLFSQKDFNELKPSGKIIINTKKDFDDIRVISFDGNSVALDVLGLSISNTVMLGAFAAVFEDISINDIERAIGLYMPSQLIQKNQKAVRTAKQMFRTGEIV